MGNSARGRDAKCVNRVIQRYIEGRGCMCVCVGFCEDANSIARAE